MARHWSTFVAVSEKQARAIDKMVRDNDLRGDGCDLLARVGKCSRSKVGRMDRLTVQGLVDEVFADVLPADKSMRQLERTLAEEGGDKQLKRLLKGLGDDYDRIVLDCPPGLSQLAEQVFEAADLIVAPEVPSPLSARALAQL